ncbi:hypothetical protein PsorP6_011130 [Peronosclerospora sorghi]|uniref:Uncharacterized protein n=1 Tax=Peronosclerospora sorghi TaxID=230839 RepID=A0ACC0VUG4_9STRA|nr:hypothetical protein PsorP6_011130 [Peronosclerospora sorghi]
MSLLHEQCIQEKERSLYDNYSLEVLFAKVIVCDIVPGMSWLSSVDPSSSFLQHRIILANTCKFAEKKKTDTDHT